MAADDDRHGLVRRLRLTVGAIEIDELAVKVRLFGRPKFAHRADIFVGGAPARFEWGVQGPELFLHPADADAEQHAPARHVIQRRHLFRGDHRIALRHDQDAGAELDPLRPRRDIRHPDQRIGQRNVVLAARHLAVVGIGILRLITLRHDHVIDGPGGFKPRRFRRLHQFDGVFRLGVARRVAVSDSEFHFSLAQSSNTSSIALNWLPWAEEGTRIGVLIPASYQASSPSSTLEGGP